MYVLLVLSIFFIIWREWSDAKDHADYLRARRAENDREIVLWLRLLEERELEEERIWLAIIENQQVPIEADWKKEGF